jgi:hypothetical protein
MNLIKASASLSIGKGFDYWCNGLESYRSLLLPGLLLIQGCLVVPTALLISSFINIGLTGVAVGTAAAGTVGVLVSNISELPLKVVIGVFILNFTVILSLITVHLLSIL